MGKFIDLTGQKFGRLTVVSRAPTKNRQSQWNCNCDCGNKLIIAGGNLRRGQRGCMCVNKGKLQDLTGKKFGKLLVIGIAKIKRRKYYYNCICDCGIEKIIWGQSLKRGQKDCGCGRLKDLTGRKFGRLTVLGFDHREYTQRGTTIYWKIKCSCGNIKIMRTDALHNPHIVGCGCNIKTHNLSETKFYRIYRSMLNRCYNKTQDSFPLYGGKGIHVCKRWKKFENFRDDMLTDYFLHYLKNESTSLDRINGKKDYSPENCRWATAKEQARNTSANHFLTFNGERKTLAEWSEILKIPYSRIFNRVRNLGWNTEQALRSPLRKKTV